MKLLFQLRPKTQQGIESSRFAKLRYKYHMRHVFAHLSYFTALTKSCRLPGLILGCQEYLHNLLKQIQ